MPGAAIPAGDFVWFRAIVLLYSACYGQVPCPHPNIDFHWYLYEIQGKDCVQTCVQRVDKALNRTLHQYGYVQPPLNLPLQLCSSAEQKNCKLLLAR